ncbi:hypothetical protein V494_05268 [Pseudogymnoascus sp. VKM F-4513 (FW-928)]|nr:hypothetical protein V494_05268 [Pseudogymnoascus sp. VKM F-4513 (FW-928)]
MASKQAVPTEIATKLEELGSLFCGVGDKEVGQLLKLISTSCDLPTLRNHLLRKQSRSSDDTRLKTDTELWLDNWASRRGEKLSDDEKSNILEVIRHWARSQLDTAQLKRNSSTWRKNPSSFCGTTPPQPVSSTPELVGLYFQEYEKIEETQKLDQVRRKIILLNTFMAVLSEERRIQALKPERKKRKRFDLSAKEATPHPRTGSHRSSAINAIARRIWDHQNLSEHEYQRKRRKLTRMSRYGEKWSLIDPPALILGLGGNSQRFEQGKWSSHGMEALNDYLKTLPIYSESLPILDGTLKVLNTEWSRHVKAQMQTPTIAQSYPQAASHLNDGVQSLMDALAQEAFRSAETPGRVAGMHDDPQRSPADDTTTIDPSTDFGTLGTTLDPAADFMNAFIQLDPSSDYVYLGQVRAEEQTHTQT